MKNRGNQDMADHSPYRGNNFYEDGNNMVITQSDYFDDGGAEDDHP